MRPNPLRTGRRLARGFSRRPATTTLPKAAYTCRTKSLTRTPSPFAIFTIELSEHSIFPRSTSPIKLLVHVSPLSQLLLSEAGLLAVLANRFAKNFAVMGPLHDLLPKQERQHPSTQ
jgi:hypothetical protein